MKIRALVLLLASCQPAGAEQLPWYAEDSLLRPAVASALPPCPNYSPPSGTRTTGWYGLDWYRPVTPPGLVYGVLDRSIDPTTGNAAYHQRYGMQGQILGVQPRWYGFEADMSARHLLAECLAGRYGPTDSCECDPEKTGLVGTIATWDWWWTGGTRITSRDPSDDHCGSWSPVDDPATCTRGYTTRDPHGSTGCCRAPITGKCGPACKTTPPPPPPLSPDRVVVCPGEIRYTPGLESTGKTVLEWSHTEDCREAP